MALRARILWVCYWRVVREFLNKVMFDSRPPSGRFDLFAVEGGTAAMCYVFDSLSRNKILRPGDTVALGTPIFTPYVELPALSNYQLKTVETLITALTADVKKLHLAATHWG